MGDFDFWFSKKTEDSFACATSDLEACCDIKLPNIGVIVIKSIGLNREVIKLITKILPRCDHFIGTTFGASKNIYDVWNESLGGTWQVNMFSGIVFSL